MAKKIKEFKRCPRCDTKALIYQDKCNACGLIYSRLANASNKEAKKAIKAGQKNRVICDKTLPKDVNKWKLFFMALFLGFFGGHFYYIGKYKTGIVFSVSAVLLSISAAIDPVAWATHYFWMWFLILPASGCFVYLAVNWIQILTNSFRVPIALKEENIVVDADNENANSEAVLKVVEQVSQKVIDDQKKEEKQKEKQSEKDEKTETNNVAKEEQKQEIKKPTNSTKKSNNKKAKK